MNYNELSSEIENAVYHPIYFLEGEEPYFIKQLTRLISTKILDESEKEFNYTILYGKDTNVDEIVGAARRFPMMAQYQIVIVKEAQALSRTIENLTSYAENPTPSTILVFNYNHKTLDKRKKLVKAIKKNGVHFTATKVKEYQISDWISNYVKSTQLNIVPKAAALMGEYLGSDLKKIVGYLDKMQNILPDGGTIDESAVQEHMGISKDYNIFELQKALGKKNIESSMKITNHFAKNEKDYPLVVVISSLFGYFSKLLKYHFSADKNNDKVLASALKVSPFFIKDYKSDATRYTAKKLVRIIGYLREYDLKSKGVNNATVSSGELLKELVFKILH